MRVRVSRTHLIAWSWGPPWRYFRGCWWGPPQLRPGSSCRRQRAGHLLKHPTLPLGRHRQYQAYRTGVLEGGGGNVSQFIQRSHNVVEEGSKTGLYHIGL